MTSKERYRQLCETEGQQIPLFLQYWWLQTVCGDSWEVALCEDKEGSVWAAMPYMVVRRWGCKAAVMPQLTQFVGPWYNYKVRERGGRSLTEFERLDFENVCAAALTSQVAKEGLVAYVQNFAPTVTNWLPYYHAGYRQTTRYTYQLTDLGDPDRLLRQMVKQRRQKIRHYDSAYTTDLCYDAAWYADFHQHHWQAKGQRDLIGRDFMVHLVGEAVRHEAGVVMRLIDKAGRPVAAAFAVYDSRCAYLLQTAADPALHANAHIDVLIWKLLGWLAPRTQTFDFEGSMHQGVEYFNRSFGARQVPFFQIEHYANPLVEHLFRRKMQR